MNAEHPIIDSVQCHRVRASSEHRGTRFGQTRFARAHRRGVARQRDERMRKGWIGEAAQAREEIGVTD